jgi:SAM-dependent methyltransferase
MPTVTDYDEAFFRSTTDGARQSARHVVPVVLGLVAPQSVIDFGCGLGAWLFVFRELGVTDVLGVDGAYVDRSRLEIPQSRFQPHDLRRRLPLDRRFDLAISLEVAEHLPPEAAARFVSTLCDASDVVMFSAAVPTQGGKGHLNEQWPEYWEALFKVRGYRQFDCLRAFLWDDPDVVWWYAQNTFIYATADHPATEALAAASRPLPSRLIHWRLSEQQPPVRLVARQLRSALGRSLRRRASVARSRFRPSTTR